jgi:hypothetical protein
MSRPFTWLRNAAAVAVIGGLAFAAAACNDDGGDEPSPEEIAAIEDVINQVFNSGAAGADYFFAHVTDNFIETALFSTREECEAAAEECIGEPLPPQSVADTEIDGDSATSTVTLDFGVAEVGTINQDDTWVVDSLQAVSDEVPAEAASVDLGMTEFAFDFEEGDIPADGNFVFNSSNTGDQPHEAAVVSIPAEGTVEEAIAGLGEDVQPAMFKIFIQPGQEDIVIAPTAPLTPGRYAMVCFFPDTDDEAGTPHADKGMIAEFTIE